MKSAVITQGPAVTEYKVGEWIYPTIKGTKLCVFDRNVGRIYGTQDCFKIYKCEVKNPSTYWSDGVNGVIFLVGI